MWLQLLFLYISDSLEHGSLESTVSITGRYCVYIMYGPSLYICIKRALIGQYSGLDFPVMPTGIMNDVYAQLVRPGKGMANDLKIDETRLFF